MGFKSDFPFVKFMECAERVESINETVGIFDYNQPQTLELTTMCNTENKVRREHLEARNLLKIGLPCCTDMLPWK